MCMEVNTAAPTFLSFISFLVAAFYTFLVIALPYLRFPSLLSYSPAVKSSGAFSPFCSLRCRIFRNFSICSALVARDLVGGDIAGRDLVSRDLVESLLESAPLARWER